MIDGGAMVVRSGCRCVVGAIVVRSRTLPRSGAVGALVRSFASHGALLPVAFAPHPAQVHVDR